VEPEVPRGEGACVCGRGGGVPNNSQHSQKQRLGGKGGGGEGLTSKYKWALSGTPLQVRQRGGGG
jgi:hypothetical protein